MSQITFIPDKMGRPYKEGQEAFAEGSMFQPVVHPYPPSSQDGMNWNAGFAVEMAARRERMADKNANILEGIRCPKCGQSSEFLIEYNSVARVTDDGAENAGDMEWDDKSHVSCANDDCEHHGLLSEFQAPKSTVVTVYALYKFEIAEVDPSAYAPNYGEACSAAANFLPDEVINNSTNPDDIQGFLVESRFAYVHDTETQEQLHEHLWES